VLSVLVPEGAEAQIGAVIAWLGEPGETPPDDAPSDTAAAPAAETPIAAAPAAPATRGRGGRVSASPVARRLARELGVDLEGVTGTGPGGMISREDVEAAAGGAAAAPQAKAPAAGAGEARGATTVEPLSRLQQTIARRMVEGASAPTFAAEVEIDMTACVALRETLGGDPKPSLNDLVVKAVGIALMDFPRLNASYTEAGFALHERRNVGVAVATDDGLVVPTIFDADTTTLQEIAARSRDLAARVRERTITPAELDGGTFTVSNLGMLGVRRFFPIVNPPQAAILGVGEVALRPVLADDGTVSAAHLSSFCLVCDHRIVYGADAARFLARLRELLEEPADLAS
jgi:pyruvate dehydrogenase E2 component (dihydrolipoamide acetyltransferase)